MMDTIALTEAVYYILLSLEKPRHGYGIIQNIEQLSHGRLKLAAGTLYGAINTLLERQWIKGKKEYQITELGREIILQELKRLHELINNGEIIIGGWRNEDNKI